MREKKRAREVEIIAKHSVFVIIYNNKHRMLHYTIIGSICIWADLA